METSPSKALPKAGAMLSQLLKYASVSLLAFCVVQSAVAGEQLIPGPLEEVLGGQCSAKNYGGFLRNAILDDGRLRLTRPKRDEDPGQRRSSEGRFLIRVLVVSEAEINSIYKLAHAKELSGSEMSELAKLCSSESFPLKSAWKKLALQEQRLALANAAKSDPTLMKFAEAFPATPSVFTPDEQSALDALRNSELAQSALKKINSKVAANISQAFVSLNVERGYDVPFSPELLQQSSK